MQSACEQHGDWKYRRQRSRRGSGPSSAAGHRRGWDGEQRCRDPGGKYAWRPWDLKLPAASSQPIRSCKDFFLQAATAVSDKIVGTSRAPDYMFCQRAATSCWRSNGPRDGASSGDFLGADRRRQRRGHGANQLAVALTSWPENQEGDTRGGPKHRRTMSKYDKRSRARLSCAQIAGQRKGLHRSHIRLIADGWEASC